MVEVMDTQIGRVIAHLEQIGELDNTFVFFSSDNGAEGSLWVERGFRACADLSGWKRSRSWAICCRIPSRDSSTTVWRTLAMAIRSVLLSPPVCGLTILQFTYLGPRWAQAATAPSRMYKGASAAVVERLADSGQHGLPRVVSAARLSFATRSSRKSRSRTVVSTTRLLQ